MLGVKFLSTQHDTVKLEEWAIRVAKIPMKSWEFNVFPSIHGFVRFTPVKEDRAEHNKRITDYANNHCKI